MSNNVLNQPSKLVDLLYFKKALGLSKKTSIDSKILTEKFKNGNKKQPKVIIRKSQWLHKY
jgi:hypothetical protein